MKCIHCGTELPDKAAFCFICGARIDDTQSDVGGSGEEDAIDEAKPEDEAGLGREADPDVADPEESDTKEAEADSADADEATSEDDATVALGTVDAGLDVDSIPESLKLEEPLSPFGAAVPMVPVAPPPRAMRMGAHSRPRTYSSYGEQPSAARAFAAAHQTHVADAAPDPAPAADAPEDPEPREKRSASEVMEGAAEALRGFGAGVKDRLSRFQPGHGVVVGVGVLVVAALAFVLIRASAGWFSPFADRSQTGPQVQPPSDGSIEPLQPQDEGEAESQPSGDAPAAKASVEDYTWAELSQISALIAEADSDDAAIELAASYNLCAKDGALDGTQTKELELNGTDITMRIAGFRQDEKADGSGVAGISFIAADSVAERPINTTATTAGGWESCQLREWLDSSLVDELPSDLADLIVPVTKRTNPAPGSGTGMQVTEETLWIPSYSELVGELDSYNKRAAAGYQSEGEQYQLFADQSVTWNAESNAILASGDEYWWLRSPDVSNSAWFMCVTPTGQATWGHRPGTEQGVLIGFCL